MRCRTLSRRTAQHNSLLLEAGARCFSEATTRSAESAGKAGREFRWQRVYDWLWRWLPAHMKMASTQTKSPDVCLQTPSLMMRGDCRICRCHKGVAIGIINSMLACWKSISEPHDTWRAGICLAQVGSAYRLGCGRKGIAEVRSDVKDDSHRQTRAALRDPFSERAAPRNVETSTAGAQCGCVL